MIRIAADLRSIWALTSAIERCLWAMSLHKKHEEQVVALRRAADAVRKTIERVYGAVEQLGS